MRRVARKLRIQYEGATYHVINRGDRREDIFHHDDDRQLFLRTLGEACSKTGWQVHAFVSFWSTNSPTTSDWRRFYPAITNN